MLTGRVATDTWDQYIFFNLKYVILYAWTYTDVGKIALEHMETFGKKCLLLTMIRGADLFSFCISKNII